jgi:hypothetical protein
MYRSARDNNEWLIFAKVAGRLASVRKGAARVDSGTRKRNANFRAMVSARKLSYFSHPS